MTREDLLGRIAESGYNIGFGAKKHFASFDLIQKSPFFTTYIPIFIGIFALVSERLSKNTVSASLLIVGVVGIYFNQYWDKSEEFRGVGVKLTILFNRTKDLYFKVKTFQNQDLSECIDEMNTIEFEFNSIANSNQLVFSDWLAHYKFFWQHEISWIAESRPFSFWRDKVPLSLYLFIFILVIACITFCLVPCLASH